jgi:hypothetical protein
MAATPISADFEDETKKRTYEQWNRLVGCQVENIDLSNGHLRELIDVAIQGDDEELPDDLEVVDVGIQ